MAEYLDRLMEWMMRLGMAENLASFLLRVGVILLMLVLAFIIDRICRKLIIPLVNKITSKTDFTWDEHLLNGKVLNDMCSLFAPVIIYILLPLALPADTVLDFLMKLCSIYIIVVFMKLISSVIDSFYALTNEHDKLKNHSLKGFYQMLKLVIICMGAIVIISILVGKNPGVILTGLGAGTAVLMLVFQDTIKGFVAGIQLTVNDMIRPGDWITMSKYGANGDVIEITLTTVKVRNWDKTIITVPPFALVNDSFQNWRGMYDYGGRRVKRSLNIDMNSVRFCTKEELESFSREPWMDGFEKTGKEEVNLYVFRHYVEYYLRHHPQVNSDLIMTVRQLQPTAQGLPIELYFFSADTNWLNYEHLQAEVFEHIIAMLHAFDLRVFQSPSGTDFLKDRKLPR